MILHYLVWNRFVWRPFTFSMEVETGYSVKIEFCKMFTMAVLRSAALPIYTKCCTGIYSIFTMFIENRSHIKWWFNHRFNILHVGPTCTMFQHTAFLYQHAHYSFLVKPYESCMKQCFVFELMPSKPKCTWLFVLFKCRCCTMCLVMLDVWVLCQAMNHPGGRSKLPPWELALLCLHVQHWMSKIDLQFNTYYYAYIVLDI